MKLKNTDKSNFCFKVQFPSASITSKAHWMVVHVPDFAKRWKFWGKMSEQPIEAMHHQFKKDEVRFSAIRARRAIVKKCIEQSCLRNSLFDQNIESTLIPNGLF